MNVRTIESVLDPLGQYGQAQKGSIHVHLLTQRCKEEANCTHDTVTIGMPFTDGAKSCKNVQIQFDSREEFFDRFFSLMCREELLILKEGIERKLQDVLM